MCCLGPHRSSVCSLEDSSVWVSFYFPCFLNNHAGLRSQPRELFQSFTPAGWMCFAEQRDCCCFHHTGLSDPRPPRRTWAPEKAISSLFPRKKPPKKRRETTKQSKKQCVIGETFRYICAIICQMSLRRVGVKRAVTFSPANADMELLRQIFIKSRPKLPVVSLSGANPPRQTGGRGRNQADIRWNGDNNRRSRPR